MNGQPLSRARGLKAPLRGFALVIGLAALLVPAWAAAAGGTVHRPKMSIGAYGFITLAVDTEANMFGLHSMR